MKSTFPHKMTFRLLRFVDDSIDLRGLTFKKNASSVNASFSQKGVDIAMAALSNGGVSNWPKLRKFIQMECSSVTGQKAKLLDVSVKEIIDDFYHEEILMLQKNIAYFRYQDPSNYRLHK